VAGVFAGLAVYSLGKRVELTREEFNEYTHHGKLTNGDGDLGPLGFQTMMEQQLMIYIHRRMVAAMKNTSENECSQVRRV